MPLERVIEDIGNISASFERWYSSFCLTICSLIIFGHSDIFAGEISGNPAMTSLLTNALQIRQLAILQQEATICPIRIDGIILLVSPERDQLVLQDDSGSVTVKMDLRNQFSVQAGQRVLIQGNCMVEREGIVREAYIDYDGFHTMSDEKSGTFFLSKGLHPISVEWFNSLGAFGLEADVMGPGISRRPIPDAMLFRKEANTVGRTNQLAHGLNYFSYEGTWDQLPTFSQLPVLKSGSIPNFDLRVRTRDEHVGLVFTGYFEAPQTGLYTFWINSDDGSKLYIDNLRLQINVLGTAKFPAPIQILPGERVQQGRENQWAEIEGIITSVNALPDGTSLQVTSGAGHIDLKIMAPYEDSLKLLLHSRIKAEGIWQTFFTIDGQEGRRLLVPGINNIDVEEADPTYWLGFPASPIVSLTENILSCRGDIFIHISGIVCSNSLEQSFVIKDETGTILVKTSQALPKLGDQIEVIGWLTHHLNGVIIRGGFYQNEPTKYYIDKNRLPLLTKVIQVVNLSRAEASRGYPVKICGVVTARQLGGFFIQDSTWSVFINWSPAIDSLNPDIGEYCEIDGKSELTFSPHVVAEKVVCLGLGNLPEPVRPDYEELLNGNMDTMYIEIHGIATAIETNDLTLLTREGEVKTELVQPNGLDRTLEGALINLRGVCSQMRDTNQMILPQFLLFNPSINVDELAPSYPFKIPLKHASDLLHFDVHADALKRVRIVAQVLGERNGEYFAMDGANGLRFEAESPVELQSGDLVNIVGFPYVNWPSPLLRETQVKVIGKFELPPIQPLDEDTMLNGRLDATLVRIRSRLISQSAEQSEQVLELQTGNRSYAARLAKTRGMLPNIPPGSVLELTGVYMGQGRDYVSGMDINSFELLLRSPRDILVLAWPSWWTFRHTLTLICGMVFIILAASVWIVLLRRQVEKRSQLLAYEIRSREQAEFQRVLEAERVRIAQDLHDDLGATLTEIRFLSAVKSRDLLVPLATRSQLDEVSEKSRQMVSSLDEIVWAVNPTNDSLPNLVNYLCHAAEEFFHNTTVRCRLDVDESLPRVALTSEVRHNLYLAVREAMNNIAKYSKANEAWLRVHWKEQTLHIVVEDNGCGFKNTTDGSGNGLTNMRRRLEKIGGHFEYGTRPGSGTACRFYLTFVKN